MLFHADIGFIKHSTLVVLYESKSRLVTALCQSATQLNVTIQGAFAGPFFIRILHRESLE